MDTITTGLGGALLAKALPEGKGGPPAVWAVTLASVVPDIDVFADFFLNDPLADLTQHRGFTHSLVGVAVLGPLLALALWRYGKDKNYRRLLGLVTLGLLWHLFTDLATSWGTMVYYPFDRRRVVWDILFIIDLAFTAILLLPQLLAWIYHDALRARRRGVLVWGLLAAFAALVVRLASPLFAGVPFRWDRFAGVSTGLAAVLLLPSLGGWGFRQSRTLFCRIGVATLILYLMVCSTAHLLAVNRVRQFVESQRQSVLALAALPQPLSPFRWSGLVRTSEGVYQSWFSVLEADLPAERFEFFPSAHDNPFVRRAQELPAVQTYLWFARFPVVTVREAGGMHVVEYTDLRFQSPIRRRPTFVFRVLFDAQGKASVPGFE
jgi:membrane-bound metal-dependent hydrolase YbcI (DUF457 family)